jgi:hypothetical protein
MVRCDGVLTVSHQLAPEQQDLRDSVAQFAREVVASAIGGDYFALCLALEELVRVDSSVAITPEAGSRSARCPSVALPR